jgi:hypothetical protein
MSLKRFSILYKMSTSDDILLKWIRYYAKELNFLKLLLNISKKVKAKPERINEINEAIKVVKSLLQQYRDIYRRLINKPKRRKEEEVPDVTEEIRYLFETYPYHEDDEQKVYSNSIAMYTIDMEDQSTGHFSFDVARLEKKI